ncbi:hypothetical protein NQ314_007795 [Rhamnusium bicolor]|uniref:Ionotropic glutamate receptor C-terminal domain-containing protein n=1 Tax=Rhamnusium bicolor TaxID=1586634 RepID=A0AAV8YJ71_9CUCU|nr:hypothetical protein NQ314_007795 [Rhamnusium bicolor]
MSVFDKQYLFYKCIKGKLNTIYNVCRIEVTAKQLYISRLTEELKRDHLRITTFSNGELSGYTTSENNDQIGTGVAFDVVSMLQKKYDFNYSIVLPEDDDFLSSTTSKGAKDILETQQADLVAAFLPIINSFRDSITYSISFDTEEWVVLMRRPKESATGSGLLAPFTTPVWILIILSLLVVGPIIYLLIYFQARLCKNDNNKVYPLPACFWFVYGALLKQGTTLNPTTDSSRLLFSTWWIFITVLTAFYTANLTAFLTLSKFTLPINEPSDIRRYKYQWVTNGANGIRNYITMENKEIHNSTKLAEKIGNGSKFPHVDDMAILESYVTQRDMMFIREKSVVNHVMYKDYKEKTKRGIEEVDRIQHLVESGIIQFKLRENLPDTEICPLNLGNTERRLRNTDLLLTYLIVAGGLVVAALIFVIEMLIKLSWKKSKKNRKARQNIQNNGKPFGYYNNNSNYNNNNINFEHVKKTTPPPPSYHTLFHPPFTFSNGNGQKKNINGRDYWVINTKGGVTELIPLRTPSALLFQYSN